MDGQFSTVAVEMREVATELTMTVAQGMLHTMLIAIAAASQRAACRSSASRSVSQVLGSGPALDWTGHGWLALLFLPPAAATTA